MMQIHERHNLLAIMLLALLLGGIAAGGCAGGSEKDSGGKFKPISESRHTSLRHNRAIESLELRWVDEKRSAVRVGVSANAICDAELDLSADIFIAVNGRQVAKVPLEASIPASEGTCAPGDLSDWCVGKCGTTGTFTCKALINNGGFDCGCSVLKIVESKPVSVKPGDRLSATINPDKAVTPEYQKRDDKLEAIIVATRVVSMAAAPATGSKLLRVAMDTTTAGKLKRLDMRSIRIDSTLGLTDFHYGPRSVLLVFTINAAHLTPDEAGGDGPGLALSGNTADGIRFVGAIHIEPVFTAVTEGDGGLQLLQHWLQLR